MPTAALSDHLSPLIEHAEVRVLFQVVDPPDAPLLVPAIRWIARRFGRVDKHHGELFARGAQGHSRGAGRPTTPLTAADRLAGYWWELSMRQVEVSRTLVFDDPRRARAFFESLITDNVGIGP